MTGVKERFATVCFDPLVADLEQALTYRLPPHLAAVAEPGMRAVVPLGPRRLEGLIIEISDESGLPPGTRLRDVSDLVDKEPVLSPLQLDLGRWLASTYMCTVGEAFRLLLPPGARRDAKRVYALAAHLGHAPEDVLAHGRSAAETEMLMLLLEHGPQPLPTLLRRAGVSRERARALQEAAESLRRRGIVIGEAVFGQRVQPLMQQLYELACSRDEAAAAAAQAEARAPRQAAVLRALQEHPDGLTAKALISAGGSAQAAQALERKGLVRRKLHEVRRRPAQSAAAGHWQAVSAAEPPPLTGPQQEALAEIKRRLALPQPGTCLLYGVTGSGKTEVYLHAIAAVLEQGRQALVLVPEIALTPQMIGRFRARFGAQVAVLHSALGTGERFDEWRHVQAGEASIVVGARSAVFAPFTNLGLIVLDEEHETSYKQDESPRYHARDVAAWLAERHGALLMLGSATPALETFTRARQGEIGLLRLPERVAGQALPDMTLVDLRAELQAGHRGVISRALRASLARCLEAGGQAILFLNRRGYSTFVLCRTCGHTVSCPDCELALTYHQGQTHLTCHWCGHTEPAPQTCPACGSQAIRYFGAGTQRVEEELQALFPAVPMARLDVDTTRRKGAHEEILAAFGRGETRVLIGTQMVAKGLDFPGVTLVGVIAADTALHFPDFRAAERTFQLLTQVAGRSGRGRAAGHVVIQTYNPEHYAIAEACRHDYEAFYAQESEIRRELGYPPWAELIKFVVSAADAGAAVEEAGRLAAALRRAGDPAAVLGPVAAPLARLRGQYRQQLLLRGRERAELRRQAERGLACWRDEERPVRQAADVRVTVDVGPQSML